MSEVVCESESIEDRMQREAQRGDFAYWSPELEAEWKAEAGDRPACYVPPAAQRVCCRPNHNQMLRRHDRYGSWVAILEAGRDYLVGNKVPVTQFILDFSEHMKPWMCEAYQWARANPLWTLYCDIGFQSWKISATQEYVEFELPHHDAGGEKAWVTRDGLVMVQVNED